MQFQRKKEPLKFKIKKFVINAPRYKVTEDNYKVLQVLDVLHMFDKVNEFGKEKSLDMIKTYLKDVNIEKDELTSIIKSYPLKNTSYFFMRWE